MDRLGKSVSVAENCKQPEIGRLHFFEKATLILRN